MEAQGQSPMTSPILARVSMDFPLLGSIWYTKSELNSHIHTSGTPPKMDSQDEDRTVWYAFGAIRHSLSVG